MILSTNVAETSLTIDGVTAVVDSGLVRQAQHQVRLGIDGLETVRISRFSAEQRAGRAGRTGPGTAYRLWTRREHERLAAAAVPEIQRVDLCRLVLEVHAWGDRAQDFAWFDPPKKNAVIQVQRLLQRLGALDQEQRVTQRGKTFLALPLHPRLGALVVQAHAIGHLRLGVAVATILSEAAQLFLGARPAARPPLLEAATWLSRQTSSTPSSQGLASTLVNAAPHLRRARDDLLRRCQESLGTPTAPTETRPSRALQRLVLAAYPDRVCRRRSPGGTEALRVGGRGVSLQPGCGLQHEEVFVALLLNPGERQDLVSLAVALDSALLKTNNTVEHRFETALGRVIANRITRYEDLVLNEQRSATVDTEIASELLAREARRDIDRAFDVDQASRQWMYRLQGLAAWMPELGLPAFGADDIALMLSELCYGKTSLAQLRSPALHLQLATRLSNEQKNNLARHAPERLRVPSGRDVRLDYQPQGPPILAVQLQQLFGLRETPRIAGGRVAVLLHLLAPNQRPVQVTQDLHSFWDRTYAEVRKELRQRYPRHAWPEDPLSAPAEDRPQRRRR